LRLVNDQLGGAKLPLAKPDGLQYRRWARSGNRYPPFSVEGSSPKSASLEPLLRRARFARFRDFRSGITGLFDPHDSHCDEHSTSPRESVRRSRVGIDCGAMDGNCISIDCNCASKGAQLRISFFCACTKNEVLDNKTRTSASHRYVPKFDRFCGQSRDYIPSIYQNCISVPIIASGLFLGA